jgi:WD40 repeat protein
MSKSSDKSQQNHHPIPYMGLKSFDEKHGLIFFGRDKEIERIKTSLNDPEVTVVVGPSGVGKTSLLAAGVAYQVNAEAKTLVDAGQAVEAVTVVFRNWGSDQLTDRLIEQVKETVKKILGKTINTDENEKPIWDLIRELTSYKNERVLLYLVLDQFEQFFIKNKVTDNSQGRKFLDLLRHLMLRTSGIRLGIVIKEEEYHKLNDIAFDFPGVLSKAIRIENLSDEAAKDAILKPVDWFNLRSALTYALQKNSITIVYGTDTRKQTLIFRDGFCEPRDDKAAIIYIPIKDKEWQNQVKGLTKDDSLIDENSFVVLDQFEELTNDELKKLVSSVHNLSKEKPTLRVVIVTRDDWLECLDQMFKCEHEKILLTHIKFINIEKDDSTDRERTGFEYRTNENTTPQNWLQLLENEIDQHITLSIEFANKLLDDIKKSLDKIAPHILQDRGNGIDAVVMQLALVTLYNTNIQKGVYEFKSIDQGVVQQIWRNHFDKHIDELKNKNLFLFALRYLITPSFTKMAQKLKDLSNWVEQEQKLGFLGLVLSPVLQSKNELMEDMRLVLDTLEKTRILRRIDKDKENPSYELFHDILTSPALERWQSEGSKGKRRLNFQRLSYPLALQADELMDSLGKGLEDDLGALLAIQAYHFDRRSGMGASRWVDHALRKVIHDPYPPFVNRLVFKSELGSIQAVAIDQEEVSSFAAIGFSNGEVLLVDLVNGGIHPLDKGANGGKVLAIAVHISSGQPYVAAGFSNKLMFWRGLSGHCDSMQVTNRIVALTFGHAYREGSSDEVNELLLAVGYDGGVGTDLFNVTKTEIKRNTYPEVCNHMGATMRTGAQDFSNGKLVIGCDHSIRCYWLHQNIDMYWWNADNLGQHWQVALGPTGGERTEYGELIALGGTKKPEGNNGVVIITDCCAFDQEVYGRIKDNRSMQFNFGKVPGQEPHATRVRLSFVGSDLFVALGDHGNEGSGATKIYSFENIHEITKWPIKPELKFERWGKVQALASSKTKLVIGWEREIEIWDYEKQKIHTQQSIQLPNSLVGAKLRNAIKKDGTLKLLFRKERKFYFAAMSTNTDNSTIEMHGEFDVEEDKGEILAWDFSSEYIAVSTRNFPHLFVFRDLLEGIKGIRADHGGRKVAIRPLQSGFLLAITMSDKTSITEWYNSKNIKRRDIAPPKLTAASFWGDDIFVGVTQNGNVNFWKRISGTGNIEWRDLKYPSFRRSRNDEGGAASAWIPISESDEDGKHLAVAFPDGVVAIFERNEKNGIDKEIIKPNPRILSDIKADFKCLAFSSREQNSEKKYLAAGGRHGPDGLVWIWDISSAETIAIALKSDKRNDQSQPLTFRSVYFHKYETKGLYVVAVGQLEGTDKLVISEWLIDAEQLCKEAQKRVLRNLTCEEWGRYIGESVDYELTIEGPPEPPDWNNDQKPPLGAWVEKDA